MKSGWLLFVIFLNIFAAIYFILKPMFFEKNIAKLRLSGISNNKEEEADQELRKPLFERMIKPMTDKMAKSILKMTPTEIVNQIEQKIITAGRPYNYNLRDWVNVMMTIGVIMSIVVMLFGFLFNLGSFDVVFVLLMGISLLLVIPLLILNKHVQSRKFLINRSLPDVLDLLTVSIEAGLGFDSALSKVIEKMAGPISKEFDIVLTEMKYGRAKKDALKSMSERVEVEELRSLVTSIIQADQLGVSMGNVFRIQSEQMREKRRQLAKEKAMKAPVKILLPMVLFIFPTIFIVLVGPVMIKVIEMFTSAS